MKFNVKAAAAMLALASFSVAAWANPGSSVRQSDAAQQARQTAGPAAPAFSVIPAKTPVLLSVNESMKGGKAKEGDLVTYTVVADVVASDGTVIVPAGSQGHGKVVSSHGSGVWSVNGKLTLSCDYADAGGSQQLAFDKPIFFDEGGGASDWHYLIFGIIGLYFWKGDDVEIAKGMPFQMLVAADTNMTAGAPAPSAAIQVIRKGRDRKAIIGKIKAFTGKEVTVASDSGDVVLKTRDIGQILLADHH